MNKDLLKTLEEKLKKINYSLKRIKGTKERYEILDQHKESTGYTYDSSYEAISTMIGATPTVCIKASKKIITKVKNSIVIGRDEAFIMFINNELSTK